MISRYRMAPRVYSQPSSSLFLSRIILSGHITTSQPPYQDLNSPFVTFLTRRF